jgi:hypothetical protein
MMKISKHNEKKNCPNLRNVGQFKEEVDAQVKVCNPC